MAAVVLVTLVFVFGVAAVMGIYVGATKLPGILEQRRLQTRLEEVSQPAVDEPAAGGDLLIKVRQQGPLPALDRLLGDSARGSALAAWIEQSGVRVSASAMLLVGLACAAVGGLAAMGIFRVPLAFLGGGVVGFAAPFLVLKIKRSRRLGAFEEQFPEALDMIARALKAGHAFATGLKMAAEELPEPVGPEFRKTFDEQNFGLPLKDSLDNLARRIPLLDVRFFATAVLIQRETGGNLSEILENLGHVVRERFKILRQVRVYTAHGRFTGYVLLALPAFLGIALSFINPDHMNMLFRERMGQMMLLGALVMQTIGFLWIKHVIKIEV